MDMIPDYEPAKMGKDCIWSVLVAIVFAVIVGVKILSDHRKKMSYLCTDFRSYFSVHTSTIDKTLKFHCTNTVTVKETLQSFLAEKPGTIQLFIQMIR